MKLNVGDLVELLYDGTIFSGVITAVTPERVELAFTLNIFVEGPGKITWPNGVNSDVDVGANALTKLHVRLPLEEVARAYAAGERLEVEAVPSLAPLPSPAPPQVEAEAEDLEALLAELGDSDQAVLADLSEGASPGVGGLPAGLPELDPLFEVDRLEQPDRPAAGGDAPAPREPRKRDGVWVEYEALVDCVHLASGEIFPASLILVSSTGCLVRSMGHMGMGDRVQLRFTLGRDSFDLSCTVVYEEADEIFEVAYDTLPSEVRVRMLRAVLGLAKPELRTQESWTYKLRQKGSG